jgi:putative transposase
VARPIGPGASEAQHKKLFHECPIAFDAGFRQLASTIARVYCGHMTARRVHAEGTYTHFVTFSCYKRRQFLAPDICKRIVIGTLGSCLAKQNGICCGFVIMPDHVHAALWFPDENQISLLMNKWKENSSKQIAAVYARQFPSYWSKIDPHDPIWQARYYGFNIYSYGKLRQKVEYMHNNPVRLKLVHDPCDWPWSSARFLLLGKPVGIPISWPP